MFGGLSFRYLNIVVFPGIVVTLTRDGGAVGLVAIIANGFGVGEFTRGGIV
jgi:hypothetical protein